MKFTDIPQLLTNKANYKVDVGFKYFSKTINQYIEEYGLILNPEFQRGHVWTEEQQEKYVEYVLKGGKPSRTIYFNMPSWGGVTPLTQYDDFVCVDGLQRITAVLKFMNNEIKIFGSYYKEFGDHMSSNAELLFNVNNLQTEKEVLQWYVDMNAGGTPHTSDEIERVREMIQKLDN